MINYNKIVFLLVFAACVSCNTFLEVDPPKSEIESNVVFGNDVTATSAVLGIYAQMSTAGSFLCGDPYSILALSGLSSDELINNLKRESSVVEFETNNLNPKNPYVYSLWTSLYKSIYQSNVAIEALSQSKGLTESVRDQLLGESFFVRAFSNFYIVNIYGDAPLVLSSDYSQNSSISRTSSDEIYNRILLDLSEATTLLDSSYVDLYGERIRPNKYTAIALEARVLLYMKRWAEAESAASAVIDNSAMYTLTDSLNDVFLRYSPEAIWQLQPVLSNYIGCTQEGRFFSPNLAVRNNLLRKQFVSSFEDHDLRKIKWVGVVSDTLFFPNKYKQHESADPTEYSAIFRLAELYLIRAEARAMLGNLSGNGSAESDINIIRHRAGLSDVVFEGQDDLVDAVMRERKFELFTELGHRWFDLKRTSGAVEELNYKPDFSREDQLYPLPQEEFQKNPLLVRQNPGY